MPDPQSPLTSQQGNLDRIDRAGIYLDEVTERMTLLRAKMADGARRSVPTTDSQAAAQ